MAVSAPQAKVKSAAVVEIPTKAQAKPAAKKGAGGPSGSSSVPVTAREDLATPINAGVIAKSAAKATKAVAGTVDKSTGKSADTIAEKTSASKAQAATQQVVVIAQPQPAKAPSTPTASTKDRALKTVPGKTVVKKGAAVPAAKPVPAKASVKQAVSSKAASSPAEPVKASARPVVVVSAKAASEKRALPAKAVKTVPTKGRSGR